MQYRNQPLELVTGDVVLYHTPLSLRPVSWLAAAIRLVTKSRWNHAAIVVCISGEKYLAEALGGGMRLRPTAVCLDRKRSKIKVLRRVMKQSFKDWIMGRSMRKLGTRYDVLAILQHLYKVVRKKWTGHTGDFAEGRMVCSEYVAYCHYLPQWWQMTPADLDHSTEFKTVFTEL